MTMTFDAVAGGSTMGTSLTFSHTCTGSNLILVVAVSANGCSGDQITGVTYGGVGMTRGHLSNADAGFYTYLYYLINPTTGANNVVISAGASFVIRGVSASYAEAKQSTQPDAIGKGSANPGTSVTAAVTVVDSTCWIIGAVQNDGGLAETAADVLTTARGHDGNNVLTLGDSNGVITTGSQNATWTSGLQKLDSVAMSIKGITPVVATAKTSYSFFI